MSATISQIQALDLGYLVGKDISRYVPAQLLVTNYNLDNDVLQNAADTAIGEMKSATRTRYDLATELAKRAGDRDVVVVKLIAILAGRNAMGPSAAMGDTQIAHFEWADMMLGKLQKGTSNLLQPSTPGPIVAQDGTVTTGPVSAGEMIKSSYDMIG